MDNYTKNIIGFQKGMKSIIEAEKRLMYNKDPESKKQFTKIRLQKKLNQKHWEKVWESKV